MFTFDQRTSSLVWRTVHAKFQNMVQLKNSDIYDKCMKKNQMQNETIKTMTFNAHTEIDIQMSYRLDTSCHVASIVNYCSFSWCE